MQNPWTRESQRAFPALITSESFRGLEGPNSEEGAMTKGYEKHGKMASFPIGFLITWPADIFTRLLWVSWRIREGDQASSREGTLASLVYLKPEITSVTWNALFWTKQSLRGPWQGWGLYARLGGEGREERARQTGKSHTLQPATHGS